MNSETCALCIGCQRLDVRSPLQEGFRNTKPDYEMLSVQERPMMIENVPPTAKQQFPFPGRFLRTLFNGHSIERHLELELRCIHAREGHPVLRRFYSSLSKFKKDWNTIRTHNKQGYNVYFSVILRDPRNEHKLPNPLILFCLWVDIDVGRQKPNKTIRAALHRIRKLTIKPTIIVKSGHGIHSYWCFKKPIVVDPAEATELLRIIADKTGGDRQSAEIARLLRMPNTINWKDNPS